MSTGIPALTGTTAQEYAAGGANVAYLNALAAQQQSGRPGGETSTATPQPPAATTPASTVDNSPQAQQSALQSAIGQLTSLGMNTADATTLANWEWTQHVAGYSDASIADMLITTPLFNQYFPEVAARQKAGLPPVTAAQIVSYKDTVAQYANQYGIPQQFVNQFTSQWITQDVSAAEVGQRLQDYAQAAYQSNPAVVQQLQTLYGVTPGELISFFADPTTALPLIQQRFQSAQIAGQAQVAGYGQLSGQQATLLAQQGVTQSQAQSGFQQLGLEQQLFNPLPGQAGQPTIDQNTQLGAQFLGDAAAQRQIQQAAAARQAAFSGGGAFANSNKGLTGVGTEQGSQA